MLELKDQIGNKLKFEDRPHRIVSLVPSLTELAAELGGEECILGLTVWCQHPKGLKETKTIIGGTKDLKLEIIRELKPDLILANKEENVFEQIEELQNDFQVYVSDVRSIEHAKGLMHDLGLILGQQKKAENYIQKASEAQKQLKKTTKSFLYFIWKDPYMVASEDSYISALLEERGFNNLAPSESRYPQLSWNEICELNPDFIFLSSEPYSFRSGHSLPFYQAGFKTMLIDGEMLSWYSHRLYRSLQYINTL